MTTTAKGDASVTQASQGSWYHGFTQAATTKYWAAVARIAIGFVFLWAFLDKNFGLGYATPSEGAWNFATGDGSPTFGYLTFGVNPEGQFAGFFNSTGRKRRRHGRRGPHAVPRLLGQLGVHARPARRRHRPDPRRVHAHRFDRCRRAVDDDVPRSCALGSVHR